MNGCVAGWRIGRKNHVPRRKRLHPADVQQRRNRRFLPRIIHDAHPDVSGQRHHLQRGHMDPALRQRRRLGRRYQRHLSERRGNNESLGHRRLHRFRLIRHRFPPRSGTQSRMEFLPVKDPRHGHPPAVGSGDAASIHASLKHIRHFCQQLFYCYYYFISNFWTFFFFQIDLHFIYFNNIKKNLIIIFKWVNIASGSLPDSIKSCAIAQIWLMATPHRP